MAELKVVAGLGNPGAEYRGTRHNIGFVVVDDVAEHWDVRDWHRKYQTRFAIDRRRNVILAQPQAYMNLSGRPIQALSTFYKVHPQDVLIVVDELDLPFGTLRMRARGSSGGHNGLKSLIEVFGQDFPRLRIGIGRDNQADAIDRVLGGFTENERKELPAIVARAREGIELWTTRGVTAAMNFVNAKV